MQTARASGRERAKAGAGRRGAWVAAVVVLLLVFLAARFPYQRLLPAVLAAARAATGAEIDVARLGLGLGLAGPHVVASDVRLRWPAAPELRLDAVRVRPAWSFGWLDGTSVWHMEATGPPGVFRGELATDRVAGEWREVDTDALPWVLLGSLAPLHGRVSGEVDLSRSEGAWRGTAQVSGTEGSVDLPGLPVAIPFVAIEGQLEVAPDLVTLSAGRIEGPLVTARMDGTASANDGAFSAWPLELAVDIERVDPALRGYLSPLGIPVDPEGRASVLVTGSLAAPYLGGQRR
jgi:type II secretion system protein N